MRATDRALQSVDLLLLRCQRALKVAAMRQHLMADEIRAVYGYRSAAEAKRIYYLPIGRKLRCCYKATTSRRRRKS